MKSLKKKFRGIVVLERDLVGKLEPKCDHEMNDHFEMKRNGTYLYKKNEFFGLFSIVHLVIKVRKMKIK